MPKPCLPSTIFGDVFGAEGRLRPAELGFATLEEFVLDWERDHLAWDANDLLSKILTWQHDDISDQRTLPGRFHARAAVDSSASDRHALQHDRYFVPEDNEAEVAAIRRAELRVFNSPWGHCVGSPGRIPEFQRALDEAVAELLRG